MFRTITIVGVGGFMSVYALRSFGNGSSGLTANESGSVPAAGARIRDDPLPRLRLINAQVVFRHGARTPLSYIPGIGEAVYDETFMGATVPYAEIPFKVYDLKTGGDAPRSRINEVQLGRIFNGGMSAGQLTTLGKDQTYLLGKRLQEKYMTDVGLISPDYSEDEVFIRSTNLVRTVESLVAVLAGMYGVEHFQEKELRIPVHHAKYETLSPNTYGCPTVKYLRKASLSHILEENDHAAIVDKVNSYIKDAPSLNLFEMVSLRDHIVARKAHGLYIPPWLDSLQQEVVDAAVHIITHESSSDETRRKVMLTFVSGPFFHMIANNMKAAIGDHKSTQRLHLYSAHDTSIIPLMIALEGTIDHWPDYAAYIAFELYQDENNDPWVKIFYCDKEIIPVGQKCSLMKFSDFLSVIKPFEISMEEYRSGCEDLELAKKIAHVTGPGVAAETPQHKP